MYRAIANGVIVGLLTFVLFGCQTVHDYDHMSPSPNATEPEPVSSEKGFDPGGHNPYSPDGRTVSEDGYVSVP